ncbi:tetraspanin-9-like [Saccostrea cucullata]|uniref:tetraspanin-9-like n=1 Tax=Saccostrea cuccullata TaxID=36930 RepID=UPI002ECFDCA5
MGYKSGSSRTAAEVFFGIANLLFLLMGLAVFVVGVYLKVSRSVYTELLDSREFETGTALCVSAGIIVVVVSLIGFWGLWMRSQFVLSLYFFSVLIIFCLEIAAGIIAYVYRNKIEDIIVEDLRLGLKDTKRRVAWDTVQEKYECCGVHNYTDWMGVYDVNVPTSIPDSCCGYPDCGESGSAAAWRIGCVEDAKEWLEENYLLLGLVCIVIGALHVLLLIITAALIFFLRRNG